MIVMIGINRLEFNHFELIFANQLGDIRVGVLFFAEWRREKNQNQISFCYAKNQKEERLM